MGCGASAKKGEGSPSLNEYFKELRKFSDEEIDDLQELVKVKKGGDAQALKVQMTKIKAKREAFDKVAEKLLTDSFNHHDVSNDGILSKEESIKVFEHLTSEKTENDAAIATGEQRRMLAIQLNMSRRLFKDIDINDEESIKNGSEAAMKAEADQNIAAIKKDMNNKLEDYRKNKAERDKAAFMVLDKSKNGQIEKKEFLSAFDQDSDLYQTFMAALGLSADQAQEGTS